MSSEDNINKIIEKWKKLGLYDDQSIIFPIVRRVAATTLASGSWIKSEKQQLKENRINKLKKLQGEEPNVILPNDEFIDGLVPVQPLSTPNCQFFYLDYKYNSINENRREKLKYIKEILKNN